MTRHAFARGLVLSALLGSAVVGVAEARNPHCAGGIQYVVQALRDKDKGNVDDYTREINKAVQQLEMCLAEDPNDFEAIGYLGWAYAEVESAGPSGRAFTAAIEGLKTKGDVKKVEQWTSNRTSYWARWFNDAIAKINEGQQSYPEFCKKAENEADVALRAQAEKSYQAAERRLTQASLVLPGDPRTARNLASVYSLRCEYAKAEAVLREGLKAAPTDTSLAQSLRNVRVGLAGSLVEEKKYDEAIAFYNDLIKSESNNADHHVSLADVIYRRAQGLKDDAQKAGFCAAADEYAKAAELRTDDADVTFNAALSYQNCQQWTKAADMWAKTVKIRPEDTDALSAWGAALVELKRCDDAVHALHKAVVLKPQEKNLHRQLGAIYTKCGNNAKGTEELMVYLALSKGQAAADAAATAKAARQGSESGKALASEGVPQQIYQWEADQEKWETWFYWDKKRAFHFSASGVLQKSDWGAAAAAGSSGAGAKK